MGRSDDWYRSPEWTPAAKRLFEEKLGRAQPWNQYQYLQTKARALLDSGDSVRRRAAMELFQRILKQYPDAPFHEIALAYQGLGECCEGEGDFGAALEYYRGCIEWCTRPGHYFCVRCDVDFAELVLRLEEEQSYAEALRVLDPRKLPDISLNSERYRFAVVGARLAARLREVETAAAYAQTALNLAAVTEPQFPRHPTLGLVRPGADELAEMHRLAGDKAD